MNKKFLITLLLFCSFAVNAQVKSRPKTASVNTPNRPTAVSNNQVLPIKKVILYSNGVAYIERRGTVAGNAKIDLQFKQSQVDDVLKSMVVLDLGQGRIGAVSYNSSAPPSARMSEIPFAIGSKDVGGIADVLSQLQGAKVSVSSAKGTASGAILTVERRSIPGENNKPPTITHFIIIASEAGEISSFDLNEVKSLKLLEEGTKRDINEFANATASARRRDAKTITVTSEGSGSREMIVSYTIAAPIWKTTYRVVLDENGKPFFQGWAIVDNVSDDDWENVQLSLISGTPISFIQPIQKPFYRYRPIVPIPGDLQLSPQVYDEQGLVVQSESRSTIDATSSQIQNLPMNSRNYSDLRNVAPQRQVQSQSNNFIVEGSSSNESSVRENTTSISSALRSGNSGVETAATGEEIGDLFEYKIEQPITVLRDRSALIPIVQTKMDGERISIYNASVRRDRPMGGMLLKNLTNLTLEAGSLTVLDRDAYAGEALMERLKPKEQRLISFALDLGTSVKVRNDRMREPAKLVKIVNGVLEVHYFNAQEVIYQVTNQTDRKKVLYVEHPVTDGWTLSEKTPKPAYTTQRYYRFRLEIDPLAEKELRVAQVQPLVDSYALTKVSRNELELFISKRYISEEVKQQLEKIIDLRNQIELLDQKLDDLSDEEDAISTDQKRLRENIETLAKTPEAKALITRYVDKVNAQETRIEQITKERNEVINRKNDLEAQLQKLIRDFELKQ